MLEQLTPVLVEIITAIVGIGIVYLRSGLPKLIESKTKEGLARRALMVADSVVLDLVTKSQQTVVSELRKAVSEGDITPEAMRKRLFDVKADVLREARSILVDKLATGLNIEPTHAEAILDAKVEAAVPIAKSRVAFADRTEPPTRPPLRPVI